MTPLQAASSHNGTVYSIDLLPKLIICLGEIGSHCCLRRLVELVTRFARGLDYLPGIKGFWLGNSEFQRLFAVILSNYCDFDFSLPSYWATLFCCNASAPNAALLPRDLLTRDSDLAPSGELAV